MILIKPRVDPGDMPKEYDAYRRIEKSARVCYQSEPCGDGATEKLIKKLLDKQHLSVFEHVSANVMITTSRGVTHEIVRHRLASYSQESTRYCKYKEHLTFIIPSHLNIEPDVYWYGPDVDKYAGPVTENEYNWIDTMLYIEVAYLRALSRGQTPQQARGILPNDLKTQISMTANLREWMHFIDLRTSPAAHPDMIVIANEIKSILQWRYPLIYGKPGS